MSDQQIFIICLLYHFGFGLVMFKQSESMQQPSAVCLFIVNVSVSFQKSEENL